MAGVYILCVLYKINVALVNNLCFIVCNTNQTDLCLLTKTLNKTYWEEDEVARLEGTYYFCIDSVIQDYNISLRLQ